MRLSHCGANADRHFIEIPNSSGRPEFQWQPVFGHARGLPWSFGSHRVPVTPRGLRESGVGILEGSVLAREKIPNFTSKKHISPGAGRRRCLGKDGATWHPFDFDTPHWKARHREAAVAKTDDLSRRPEILKPAPIRHFSRFSLRADFSQRTPSSQFHRYIRYPLRFR